MKNFFPFIVPVTASCLVVIALTAAMSQIRELIPDFSGINKETSTAIYSFEAESLFSDMIKSFINRNGGKGNPDYSVFYHDDQIVLPAKAGSYINTETIDLTYLMDDSSLVLTAEVTITGDKSKIISGAWTVSRESMLTELLQGYNTYPENFLKYPELIKIVHDSFLPRDYNLSPFFENFSVSRDNNKVILSGKLKTAQYRITPSDDNWFLPGKSFKVIILGDKRYRKEAMAEAEKYLADCGLIVAKENSEYTLLLTLDSPVTQNIKNYSSSGNSCRTGATYELKDRTGVIYTGAASEAAFHVSKKSAECKSSINASRSAVKECIKYLIRKNYSVKN